MCRQIKVLQVSKPLQTEKHKLRININTHFIVTLFFTLSIKQGMRLRRRPQASLDQATNLLPLTSKVLRLSFSFFKQWSCLLQVAGRNVILFVIFGSLEEMQNKAVVFFVFYLWSTIEIFRSAQAPPPCFLLGRLVGLLCILTSALHVPDTRSTCWPASAQTGSL